jgi:hypothetical protein
VSVYQVQAQLPAGQSKTLANRSHEEALEIVTEFIRDSTLTSRWGNRTQTRQAYELRVFETEDKWDRRKGRLEDFVKGKRNAFSRLEREAKKRLPQKRTRVFVVMPIQGDRYGSQSEQNVHREYDSRFERISDTLQEFGCVSIRIDKESPLGGLVEQIKDEIARARFVVADLTDERPSCYFEAGYAEALGKPVIYIASRESIMNPGQPTRIHFDIHQNIRLFSNQDQMADELRTAVERNRKALLEPPERSELIHWPVIHVAESPINPVQD